MDEVTDRVDESASTNDSAVAAPAPPADVLAMADDTDSSSSSQLVASAEESTCWREVTVSGGEWWPISAPDRHFFINLGATDAANSAYGLFRISKIPPREAVASSRIVSSWAPSWSSICFSLLTEARKSLKIHLSQKVPNFNFHVVDGELCGEKSRHSGTEQTRHVLFFNCDTLLRFLFCFLSFLIVFSFFSPPFLNFILIGQK